MTMIVCGDELPLDLQLQIFHILTNFGCINEPRESSKRKKKTNDLESPIKVFPQQINSIWNVGKQEKRIICLDRLQNLS